MIMLMLWAILPRRQSVAPAALRGLEDSLPQQVDFFSSNDGPAPFWDEIVELAGRFPMLRGLQRDLQRAGVPARRIHREFFDWR